MNETIAIFTLVSGIAAIGIATFSDSFYWRKGWLSGKKAAPRWVGRAIFGLGGTLFILVGLKYLLIGN